MVFDFFVNFLKKIWQIWDDVPEDDKNKIIEAAWALFQPIFAAFFKHNQAT